MKIKYYQEYSPVLGRDMEFKVYGTSGKPVIGLPCGNGRFYDWENFGMIDNIGHWIRDAGPDRCGDCHGPCRSARRPGRPL